MQTPTPGKANSAPRIGPIVISEIFYAAATDPDLEFLELLNITAAPVPLYDSVRSAPWSITDGIVLKFPSDPPLIVGSGERLVLTRSLSHFNAAFTVPVGTRVLEWTTGRLANEGESVQLGRPAGLDDAGVRQFARVDRVNYDRNAPGPPEPRGRVNPCKSGWRVGTATIRLHGLEQCPPRGPASWVCLSPIGSPRKGSPKANKAPAMIRMGMVGPTSWSSPWAAIRSPRTPAFLCY